MIFFLSAIVAWTAASVAIGLVLARALTLEEEHPSPETVEPSNPQLRLLPAPGLGRAA